MSKKVYVCAMGILTVLLLFGTFFDLQISQTIYNPEIFFSKFFYGFGQVPSMLSVSFGFLLLAAIRSKTHKAFGMITLILFGAASLYYAELPFLIAGYYLEWQMTGQVTMMILGLLIFVGMCLGAKKLLVWNERKILFKTSLSLIILFYSVTKLCGILKNIWGRPRFYSFLDNPAHFSPWYRIVGTPLDDTFKSFPSGHAADACMILSIILLAKLVPKLSAKTTLLYTIAFIWTACVMLARIIAGAHFLSDVSVGAGLTCTIFFLLTNLLMQNTKPEVKS